MKLPYIVSLLIICILLTILHSYKDPTLLHTQIRCNKNSICVVCPQLQHSNQTFSLEKYTRVSHTKKFYILSTNNSLITQAECKDGLQLVESDQKGAWILTQSIKKQLQNISYKFQAAEEVTLATGTQYHAIITDMQDYLIFYEANSNKSPSIYIQNEANSQKLMSLSRSLSWGMLLSLILKYVDSYIGICNVAGHYPFPLVEVIILSYILFISYQISTFQYLYLAQLMFLLYLLINLVKTSEIIKLVGTFLLFLVLGESYGFLANLLWLLYMKKMNHSFMNQSQRIKISSVVVIIGLMIEMLELLSKFNYLIYMNYAYKVISIVVCFMMFQVEQQVDSKPNNREVDLNRYMID